MKKFITLIVFVLSLISLNAVHLYTVSNPTCGLISKGEARLYQKMYKDNGIAFGTKVGLFDNFAFGVSYGGTHLVGNEKPEWHNKVDFQARLRIIQETLHYPAFALGVNTQGHGVYHNDAKRYDFKSKGAYLVASKNYSFMGLIGFDAGFNYTFEKEKQYDEENFDIFAGMYKTVGQNLTVFADFSAGINDNTKENPLSGRGRGYFNVAAELRVNDQLTLKLLLHDLFKNKETTNIFDRSLMIDYRWFF